MKAQNKTNWGKARGTVLGEAAKAKLPGKIQWMFLNLRDLSFRRDSPAGRAAHFFAEDSRGSERLN